MQSAFFPAQQQQQSKDGDQPHASCSSKRAAVTHTGSPSRQGAAGSIGQVTTSGSRALRFPSSRRYLWDRTPAGPQVLIDVLVSSLRDLKRLTHTHAIAHDSKMLTRPAKQCRRTTCRMCKLLHQRLAPFRALRATEQAG